MRLFIRKYKYKIGETIVCGDNLGQNFITTNKDYVVKETQYSMNDIELVKIIHDYNSPIYLPISLFMSKKEYRIKKLIKLNNNKN